MEFSLWAARRVFRKQSNSYNISLFIVVYEPLLIQVHSAFVIGGFFYLLYICPTWIDGVICVHFFLDSIARSAVPSVTYYKLSFSSSNYVTVIQV